VISLNDIVKNLRETRAIPESGLDCLDSIANTDVSQFLKRFINNNKNTKFIEGDNKENNKPKKKQWKCLRKNKNISKENISKKQYPAALRSFAITLHFYSPKAYDFVRKKFCNPCSTAACVKRSIALSKLLCYVGRLCHILVLFVLGIQQSMVHLAFLLKVLPL